MRNIIFILILPFFLTSCYSETKRKKLVYTCNCEQQAKASSFVKETIGAANNMSDEEMEDVISQLERTSIKLHCSQTYKDIIYRDGFIVEILDVKPEEIIYPYY